MDCGPGAPASAAAGNAARLDPWQWRQAGIQIRDGDGGARRGRTGSPDLRRLALAASQDTGLVGYAGRIRSSRDLGFNRIPVRTLSGIAWRWPSSPSRD